MTQSDDSPAIKIQRAPYLAHASGWDFVWLRLRRTVLIFTSLFRFKLQIGDIKKTIHRQPQRSCQPEKD